MDLNCKPGDLAIIVRNPVMPPHEAAGAKMIGRIVQVIQLIWGNGVPVWTIEPFQIDYLDRRLQIAGLADKVLKPITDSDPDPADGELLFLKDPLPGEAAWSPKTPTPTPETVT
jgi:hypothetical protein